MTSPRHGSLIGVSGSLEGVKKTGQMRSKRQTCEVGQPGMRKKAEFMGSVEDEKIENKKKRRR